MATIQSSDISFLLSGGSSNQNPNLSLGGAPSTTPVIGSLNSLFSDVDAAAATSGLVDYRCFYVLNKSASETLYSASVHVHVQSTGGSYAELGIASATEVQQVQISGNPTSGALAMRLGDKNFSASWGGSASNFLGDLLYSLSSAGLGDISVGYSYGSSHLFTMYFLGSLNNRAQPLMEVTSNGLSPSAVVAISRQTQGSPINSTAPLIATASTAPAGVTFSQTSPSLKLSIGSLGPGDSFPVWVRRTTPAGTGFKENDTATIRLSGDPFGTPTGESTPSSSSSGA